MYDRLVAVLQERPQTVVVRSTSGDPAATYERLVRALP